jgi:hypothetical protein
VNTEQIGETRLEKRTLSTPKSSDEMLNLSNNKLSGGYFLEECFCPLCAPELNIRIVEDAMDYMLEPEAYDEDAPEPREPEMDLDEYYQYLEEKELVNL